MTVAANLMTDVRRPASTWFEDAKLGIFVYWGLYSVPAFADPAAPNPDQFMRDLAAMKDTGGRIPYAEWYLNCLRVPGSATAEHHARTYGEQFSYFDFQRPFEEHARIADLEDWADLRGRRCKVRRHGDAASRRLPAVADLRRQPHMPRAYRSGRDLVGDLGDAVRARGLKMGVYHAGGIDWTFTQRPVHTMLDLVAELHSGPNMRTT